MVGDDQTGAKNWVNIAQKQKQVKTKQNYICKKVYLLYLLLQAPKATQNLQWFVIFTVRILHSSSNYFNKVHWSCVVFLDLCVDHEHISALMDIWTGAELNQSVHCLLY